MSKTKVDELYLTLGLDMSQYDADFVTADKKTKDAIKKLQQDNKNIALRADIEIANAGVAKDSVKGIEIQMQHLGQIIENNKKILSAYQLQYQAAVQYKGADSKQAQDLETGILRQQKALADLQVRYKALGDMQPTGFWGKLTAGADSFGNKISGLQGKIFAFGAALAGGFGLVEMIKGVADAGDNLYKLQTRLHLTAEQAKPMSLLLNMSGVGAKELSRSLVQLDKAYQSNSDSGKRMQQTMDKYGMSLKDDAGNMLPYNEQLGVLAEMHEKAENSGQSLEEVFVDQSQIFAKLNPVLEDYKDKMEVISKLKGTGIAMSPGEAHDTKISLTLLEEQFKIFAGTTAKALAPLVSTVIKPLTDGLGMVATVMNKWKAIPSIIGGIGVSLGALKLVSMFKNFTTLTVGIKYVKDLSGAIKGTIAVASAAPTVMGKIGTAAKLLGLIFKSSFGWIGLLLGAATTIYSLWSSKKAAEAAGDKDKDKDKPTDDDQQRQQEEDEKAKQRAQTERELQSEIYGLTHSTTEKELHDIDEKAKKYEDEKIDELTVMEWADTQKQKILDEQERRENEAFANKEKSLRKNAVYVAQLEAENARKELGKVNTDDTEKYLAAQSKYADALMNLYTAQIAQYDAMGQYVYASEKLLAEANSIDAIGGDSSIKRYEAARQAMSEYLSELDKIRQTEIELWSANNNLYNTMNLPKGTQRDAATNEQLNNEKYANVLKEQEHLQSIHRMLESDQLGARERKDLLEKEVKAFAAYEKAITDGITDAENKIDALNSKIKSNMETVADLFKKAGVPEAETKNMYSSWWDNQVKWWDSKKQHTIEDFKQMQAAKEQADKIGVNTGDWNIKSGRNYDELVDTGRKANEALNEAKANIEANKEGMANLGTKAGEESGQGWIDELKGGINRIKEMLGGALNIPLTFDTVGLDDSFTQSAEQLQNQLNSIDLTPLQNQMMEITGRVAANIPTAAALQGTTNNNSQIDRSVHIDAIQVTMQVAQVTKEADEDRLADKTAGKILTVIKQELGGGNDDDYKTF
jgi:hypothetical protein